jgi:soluble lytic murein transglycosylase
MSSMHRKPLVTALLVSVCTFAAPAAAQQGNEWDAARANLVATQPGPMAATIARWQQLSGNASYSFNDYAVFLLAFPGFPDEDKLRGYAEGRLREEFAAPQQVLAFFDRYPPVTNFAKAHYAIAQMGSRPDAAAALAKEAWRGGQMTDTSWATISQTYWNTFTQDDHDARMDALLWQRDRAGAERQLPYTSPARSGVFRARLAILQGGDGATGEAAALRDAGYLYNRSRELRQEGRAAEAVSMMANRLPLTSLPFDATLWVEEQLAVARAGTAAGAQAIAARIDDGFEPNADISAKTYKLRDDYTSLMWLGGTRALWERGDALGAAPLFYRYGAAARTPQTRSKGFFWAGEAASRGGNAAEAQRYWNLASQYADRFYGQLALERLGRPLPAFAQAPAGEPTPAERAAFISAPITLAVTEVARDAPWSTGIRFYRAIASQAKTVGEHLLVAELARQIGRRDLAVNLHDSAGEDGHLNFTRIGFPTMVPPPGTNWTMVHAITRQESQFAQNAISHAGARGLMQLMPGTAREEADKAGIRYMQASLIDDPSYNVQLGSNHIERLYARYNSWPLAAAAYNAGPGNVNKWLRENGDPRTGRISWVDWIERIPFSETRGYVQRVMENAVVYEALYPQLASAGRSRPLSEFLR